MTVLEFAHAVVRGLSDNPRKLDCRYLYDEHGSRIFSDICRQPEYYLTAGETEILRRCADDIAETTGKACLIEFGSGDSEKTQLLLEAYYRRYGSVCYAPVDISKSALEEAEAKIRAKHPPVRLRPHHGPYEKAYWLFSELSPVIFTFLGSNLGNLDASAAKIFWEDISGNLQPGDFCLLGVDINEDEQSLNRAYNDAAGHSAAFTKNIFARMNRELDSSIDTDLIAHEAAYVPSRQRVEIFGRFREAQSIFVAPLNQTFHLPAGERVLTEVSHKFRLETLVPGLLDFSLETIKAYKDKSERFALLLLRRQRHPHPLL